jgi:S-DNA-T family DNA segregation ATPase FtsK/SpoIIIE
MYAVTSASGQFHPQYLAATVPMMLASSGITYWNSLRQRRTYNQLVTERETSYQEALQERTKALEQQAAEQQQALRERDPSPLECLDRAYQRADSLWERSPGDADFLRVRLGLGQQRNPSNVRLAEAVRASDLDSDPLLAEGRALAARFAELPDVPICLSLAEATATGVQGSRQEVLALARSIVIQIAAHHSPDEVKIAGLLPRSELADWEWLRWLPHTWSDDRAQRYLAATRDGASQLLGGLEAVLRRRTANRDYSKDVPSPVFVFLVADESLVEGQSILQLLLSQDSVLGVSAIFVLENLPNRCQAIVDLRQAPAQLMLKAPTVSTTTFQLDQVDVGTTDRFARALAPIRPTRLAPTRAVLPDTAPLLPLLGADHVEDLDVFARWRTSDPTRSLAVSVGRQLGDARLTLDVHEAKDGPHGLVAGQTRWGKSAFLRTYIAALALAFHPHEVAFVLIDYKGGSLWLNLKELPHVVGTINDLEEHLARRALLALKGELRRREEIFTQFSVSTLGEYQRRHRNGTAPEPLPHLFVICDEFKELVVNQPEFAQEFITTASKGGSLGVHLILATQQPDGVVSDQIWANTRFRVCFHFDNPASSRAVLRRPEASSITVRGRGYLQVGDDERFELFQSGFADAANGPDDATDSGEIFEVLLDGRRVPLAPSATPRSAGAAPGGTTQVEALVRRVLDVTKQNGVASLPRFWQEPLSDKEILTDLLAAGAVGGWDGTGWRPGRSWLAPIVGKLDDPSRQWQGEFRLDFARSGNLGVYGGPQSGKSIFLQTIVVSLALTYPPTEVVVYLLDFGGQSLTALARLPHVGGVVVADEPERLSWFFRYILGELERRKRAFADAGVDGLRAYRQATREELPAIVIGLDNYAELAATYPDAEEQLARLAQEGSGFGIYVVVTSSTPRIRQRLKDTLAQSVAFHLVDPSDYVEAVGRTAGLEPADLSGRGLTKGTPPLEFQAALPVAREDTERAQELRQLVQSLNQAWNGPRPRAIPRVPDVVRLVDLLDEELTPGADDAEARVVPLGLDLQSLDPLVVDLRDGPYFLITGSIGSGKSTLLRAWLLGLARRYSAEQVELYLVDLRLASLRPLAILPRVQRVRGYVTTAERFAEVLASLEDELRSRAAAFQARRTASLRDVAVGGGNPENGASAVDGGERAVAYSRIVLAIDDFDAFNAAVDDDVKQRLGDLLSMGRELGFHVLLAGSSADLAAVTHETILRAMRRTPAGFVLGTSEYDDIQLLNLRLAGARAEGLLPPGQGYFGRRNRTFRIKAAVADELIGADSDMRSR